LVARTAYQPATKPNTNTSSPSDGWG